MAARRSKIVYLNSEDRISGTASNFTYQFDVPDGLKPDTCCVLSMIIPRSYYLVRAGYNRMNVIADSVVYPIDIEPGNYNANNFASTLLMKLNVLGLGQFNIELSSITGKYRYAYSGTAADVAFQFEDPSRLGHQTGFDEVSTNHFVGGVLFSQNVLNFISTSTLFLHSDMVDDTESVLQEIYADNTIPFSNLVYNCKVAGLYSKKMQNSNSSLFNFSLCDEHGKEVDLNGHEICVTLLLYKKEDLTRTFQKGFDVLIDQLKPDNEEDLEEP
jgi:hypothetical protein